MIPYSILAIENDGDREFMTKIFENYHRLMYHEIFAILKDTWLTEDVLQSTIIKLIDKIDVLRTLPRARQVNYIISASKNSARNAAKQQKREAAFSFDEIRDSDDEYSDDPIEARIELIAHEFDLELLHQVWPKLDERSKYLLEGRYILNKETEEMASDLGIQPKSIRMALTRAKREAKKLMMAEMARTTHNR
jgi:RNA polymerase sigma-70 factor (ECF subfamily)